MATNAEQASQAKGPKKILKQEAIKGPDVFEAFSKVLSAIIALIKTVVYGFLNLFR